LVTRNVGAVSVRPPPLALMVNRVEAEDGGLLFAG
jgi:hypothetical protein